MPWSRYSALLSSEGVPVSQLVDQDAVFTDLKQDVAFSSPTNATNISEVRLEGAGILADGYLIFQYVGDSCLVPIGGHVTVEADGGVELHFYAGKTTAHVVCLAASYTYRATLLLPGAKEQKPVTSTQGAVPNGVSPPLTKDLPAVVITPAELPAWPTS